MLLTLDNTSAHCRKLTKTTQQLQSAANAGWLAFLGEFAEVYDEVRAVVAVLGELDCLFGLAQVATQPGFTKPTILDVGQGVETTLLIENGSNPVVNALLDDAQFVPNSTELGNGPGAKCCYIITGPNMGGKSCYIRQVALISIMAQIGSYVPADSASLTPLDAVYTRMGAEDNIFKKVSVRFRSLPWSHALTLSF